MATRGARKVGGGSEAGLVLAIASGRGPLEASRSTGIPYRTVSRRCADPAFRREVAAARAELLDRALGRLSDVATGAASALGDLLSHRSPWVRLQSARAILESLLRIREHLALGERLAELEATLARLDLGAGAGGTRERSA